MGLASLDQVDELISKYNVKNNTQIRLKNGWLRIPKEAFNSLQDPLIDSIVSHIGELCKKTELDGLRYILLVGGFSESKSLQKRIKDAFNDKNNVRVVVPQRPGLCVMTGGIHYAMEPTIINSRVTPRSVGIGTAERWDNVKHRFSGKQKFFVNGKAYCDEIFLPFIQAGDHISINKKVVKIIFPLRREQTYVHCPVYWCEERSPTYTTDHGMKYVGELRVEIPQSNLEPDDRKIRVTMKFGGSSFEVKARYLPEPTVPVRAEFGFFFSSAEEDLNLTKLAIG